MVPITAVSLFGKVAAIDKGRLTVWLSWTTKKRVWVAAGEPERGPEHATV
jgi:hypothetical protein